MTLGFLNFSTPLQMDATTFAPPLPAIPEVFHPVPLPRVQAWCWLLSAGALSVGKRLADKKRTTGEQLESLRLFVDFARIRDTHLHLVVDDGRMAPWSCLRSLSEPGRSRFALREHARR